MVERNVKNVYYVYVYLDPTRPGDYNYGEYHFKYEPFYVGKGHNGRDKVHLKGCKHNKEFKQRINEIKENIGINPIVERVWSNLFELDAFHLEWVMMKTIGTKYSKSYPGPLFNKSFINVADAKLVFINKSTTYILEHPYVKEKELCSGKYEFIRFCKNLNLDCNTLLNGLICNGWKLEII